MTRFIQQHDPIDVGGTSLTVMAKPGVNLAELAGAAKEALEDARTYLQKTIRILNSSATHPLVLKLAKRYFLTGDGPIGADDLDFIKSNLELTLTGLMSDVTIKTGTKVGRGDREVEGQVNKTEGANPIKSYHTVTEKLIDLKEYTYGAIKIDAGRLQSALAAKTLVHEATHKYAGTDDYCYFGEDSITPRSTFDRKSRALCNADSYAWFVIKIGQAPM